MKIFITGGSGQIAFDLKRLAAKKNIHFYAPTREELHVSDVDAVHAAIEKYLPNVVINTAAYTRVDHAEQDVENAFAANFYGARHIAMACKRFQCPLIHLSTDYVFDGRSSVPYRETDIVNPVNIYGESKWRGEEAIREHCEQYMILRVSAVFGVHGHNFVKSILRLSREKDVLRIVSDQITCPTPAKAIAETILAMCQSSHWGVFHYCGAEAVSWHEFAKSILAEASQFESLRVNQIDPISTTDYPTPAKRPLYSVFNCEKIQKVFNIHQPDWRVGLKHVITELYSA